MIPPSGAYTAGPYAPHNVVDAGALVIDDVPAGHDVVVTGPNGFNEGYGEPLVIEALAPGLYAVAASGEGSDTSITTVEVQAGQQLPVTPTTVSLE